jgi:hypothetical protein
MVKAHHLCAKSNELYGYMTAAQDHSVGDLAQLGKELRSEELKGFAYNEEGSKRSMRNKRPVDECNREASAFPSKKTLPSLVRDNS